MAIVILTKILSRICTSTLFVPYKKLFLTDTEDVVKHHKQKQTGNEKLPSKTIVPQGGIPLYSS